MIDLEPSTMGLPDLSSADCAARLEGWLSSEAGIGAAWLFGSRARGDGRPDSDLDVAVLRSDPRAGAPPSWRQQVRWRAIAAKRLGLPSERVDLVVLPDAGPMLAHAVLREGILLFDRLPAVRQDWQERALHEFVVAARIRDEAARERRRRFLPESAAP